MTRVPVYFAMLAALAWPAAAATQISERPAVGLYLDFERTPSSAITQSMKAEVERILEPSGLRLDWRMLEGMRTDENFESVAVIRFHGDCGVYGQPVRDHSEHEFPSLASTQIVDGHVLPFTDVRCGALARYIAPLVIAPPGPEWDRILGRALGRIVAHELYHVFSGSRSHASDGVARAYHTRRDLVAKEFNFQEAESEMFRAIRTRIESVKAVPPETATANSTAGGDPGEVSTRGEALR
jgi:hypothetical protein